MTAAACRAWSVDDVLGGLPVRQWVLTTPHRLRYALAYDHRLSRRVRAVFLREVLSAERRRARRRGVADGRSGSVTAIQRFGSAANVNIHFQSIVVQGVFAGDGARFVPLPAPSDHDIWRVLATVRRRRHVLLVPGQGLRRDEGLDPTAAEPDPLAHDEGERLDWSDRIFPSVRNLRFNEMEYSVHAEPHALGVIRNTHFWSCSGSERAAVLALFHDAGEVITGDIVSPIKHFDPKVLQAHAEIEESARQRLHGRLPDALRDAYAQLLFPKHDESEAWAPVHAADKLCAYLKCLEELRRRQRGLREGGASAREEPAIVAAARGRVLPRPLRREFLQDAGRADSRGKTFTAVGLPASPAAP